MHLRNCTCNYCTCVFWKWRSSMWTDDPRISKPAERRTQNQKLSAGNCWGKKGKVRSWYAGSCHRNWRVFCDGVKDRSLVIQKHFPFSHSIDILFWQGTPGQRDPLGHRPPWTQTPLDRPRPPECILIAAVKTFDANIDNTGNFVILQSQETKVFKSRSIQFFLLNYQYMTCNECFQVSLCNFNRM